MWLSWGLKLYHNVYKIWCRQVAVKDRQATLRKPIWLSSSNPNQLIVAGSDEEGVHNAYVCISSRNLDLFQLWLDSLQNKWYLYRDNLLI